MACVPFKMAMEDTARFESASLALLLRSTTAHTSGPADSAAYAKTHTMRDCPDIKSSCRLVRCTSSIKRSVATSGSNGWEAGAVLPRRPFRERWRCSVAYEVTNVHIKCTLVWISAQYIRLILAKAQCQKYFKIKPSHTNRTN